MLDAKSIGRLKQNIGGKKHIWKVSCKEELIRYQKIVEIDQGTDRISQCDFFFDKVHL